MSEKSTPVVAAPGSYRVILRCHLLHPVHIHFCNQHLGYMLMFSLQEGPPPFLETKVGYWLLPMHCVGENWASSNIQINHCVREAPSATVGRTIFAFSGPSRGGATGVLAGRLRTTETPSAALGVHYEGAQ